MFFTSFFLFQAVAFCSLPSFALSQFPSFPSVPGQYPSTGFTPNQQPFNTNQQPGFPNQQSFYPNQQAFNPNQQSFNPNQNYFPQNPNANANANANTVAFMLTNGNSNSVGTQASRGVPFTSQTLNSNAYVSASTGLFTTTVPGIYFFTLSAQTASNSACQVALQRDNEVIFSFVAQLNSMGSQSGIVQLTARQTVYPATIGSCTNVNFGGFLIAPIMGGYHQQPNRQSPFPRPPYFGGRFRSYG